jgi:hypothetical protein
MNPSTEDIKQMLVADPSVDTDGYFVQIGRQPADPINCITLFDYGAGALLTLDKSEDYEYPSVQIRVRAMHYLEGWNLIDSIKQSLHGRANEPWNGAFYALIKCVSGPMFLAADDNERMEFVVNFDIQRRLC